MLSLKGEKKFHLNFSEPLNRQGLQLSYSLKTMQIPLWCLDDLVKCLKKGQKVLPVFYKVDPSEVCKQSGKYGLALAEHERDFKETVWKWRAALVEVANLFGLTYKDGYVLLLLL